MNWDQRVAPSALRILIKWGAGQSTPANPAGRASIPSLMEKAASNALRERTLRRGEPAHPALRVSTRRLEQLPAYPVLQASTLRRGLVPVIDAQVALTPRRKAAHRVQYALRARSL